MENINFKEFQKINLRVARIISTEEVKKSKKLLKLEIDIGDEKRQIIAGIANFYQPEDLIEKEIIVLVNLEPRTLMGIESQGMLLAASDEGRPVLLRPDEDVPPGTKIR